MSCDGRKARDMNIEISEGERDLLLELIDSAEQEGIQSMDHADSRAFRGLLKTRLDLLATMKETILNCVTHAA